MNPRNLKCWRAEGCHNTMLHSFQIWFHRYDVAQNSKQTDIWLHLSQRLHIKLNKLAVHVGYFRLQNCSDTHFSLKILSYEWITFAIMFTQRKQKMCQLNVHISFHWNEKEAHYYSRNTIHTKHFQYNFSSTNVKNPPQFLYILVHTFSWKCTLLRYIYIYSRVTL